ncbi:MAG: bifunctional UDP-N-acetylmuramoyl-tripeptide:D-alanyl-D-alanine ligase/alanine racemase, partial [Ferruginibacter sp.]|nr:bifunctional UDP-N-acetylmuramoyl-tripeptide:D-alanyl-D-alanine ligase/alanine racemase [Ferruginibacter sp.]
MSNNKVIIYPKDDSLLHEAVTQFRQNKNDTLSAFSWGTHPEADVHVYKIEKQTDSASICIRIHQNDFHFFIPFSDDASIHNAITTFTVALYLKINPDIISSRLKEIRPIEMRLELKQGINQCDIINDSYSADLSSLFIAVDFLKQQKHDRKTVIVSDFMQTGSENVYDLMANYFQTHGINRLIGIGKEISAKAKLFNMESYFFDTTDDFLKVIHQFDFSREGILI